MPVKESIMNNDSIKRDEDVVESKQETKEKESLEPKSKGKNKKIKK